LDKPSETYLSGRSVICFVPRMFILRIRGVKTRWLNYVVAVKEEGDWLFLDLADHLRHNPKTLTNLFPGLPADAKLPPNIVEKIE
jgi:hypothetical protein